MSINLHIDTLVLDGLTVQPHQISELKEAIQAVLTHQLAQNQTSDTSFVTSSATGNQSVNAGNISINRSQSMENIGQKIGNAVYWGIRK